MKISKIYLSAISLLVILVMFAVFMLFKIKYYTDDLDKMLNQITVEIEKKSDSINVLQAELSYLSNPKRLEYLASKYTKMQPISGKHIKRESPRLVIASK